MLFNYFAWQLDKTVNGKADKVETKEEQELLYQKTKGKKKKKQRVYNYSKKTLARYEKMKIELANDLRTSGATRSKTPNVYQFTVRNVQGDGQIFTATMSGLSKLDINAFLVNKGYEVYQIKTSKLITKLFGVEGDIALKNIKRNKKKYRVTTISLLISIVLFISFSAYMNYTLNTASSVMGEVPYDYRISYFGDDNNKEALDQGHYQPSGKLVLRHRHSRLRARD